MRESGYIARYQLAAPNLAMAPYDATDGAKHFELTAEKVRHTLIRGITMRALGYNGSVPGPLLVFEEHEPVEVILHNRLREPTAIHWRGIRMANDMDGCPVTGIGPLVQPGDSFTYTFTPRSPGTFLYHAHLHGSCQQTAGMAGMVIVLPLDRERIDRDYAILLQSWNLETSAAVQGLTQNQLDWMSNRYVAPIYDIVTRTDNFNYFTMNGKSFPDTAPLPVHEGERVRIRIGNAGGQSFSLHLHGHPFMVVALDGYPLPAPIMRHTVAIGPGETQDIVFRAENPGTWALHAENPKCLMNGQQHPGGLLTTIRYLNLPESH